MKLLRFFKLFVLTLLPIVLILYLVYSVGIIKNRLYEKVNNYDFEALLKKKGYAYFTKGDYNLNIIGVRAKGTTVTNMYDDILIVIYNENGKPVRKCYNITTDPGMYYMENPMNSKGTAILVPNQYRSTWKIGLHRGEYEALCQAKAVKVYRDGNQNRIYNLAPETIDTGMFGINIHRSAKIFTLNAVNQYSAGCQVFNSKSDFVEFMKLCNKSAKIFGNSFTYTLIKEEDL